METPTNKPKNLSFIIVMILTGVIVIILSAFIFLQFKKQPVSKNIETQKPIPSVTVIQETNDLQTATTELDNTDLDSFDQELTNLDTEALSF